MTKHLSEAQYKLVVECEDPHCHGLRHKGVSGDIANRLLLDFLQRRFPRLSFGTGVVSKARSSKKRYKHSSEKLSPQADVIAYVGSPYFRRYQYVVVPRSRVLFVAEVKKWIAPQAVSARNRRLNGQLTRLRKFVSKPVILVSFRHHGDASVLKRNAQASRTFLFSDASPRGYPCDIPNFRRRHLHAGELEGFCKWVKQRARKGP